MKKIFFLLTILTLVGCAPRLEFYSQQLRTDINRFNILVVDMNFINKDENGTLIPEPKEFEIVKSIFSLRKSGLKIRQISDVIKTKFGRRIHFTQCHRILNREYNQKLLESA